MHKLLNNTSARRSVTRGFTLIEVMVALAIVAMALPALLFRFQQMLDHTGRIEEQNYATWLAQNKYKELVLNTKITQQFEKTKESDTEKFAELDYFWTIETFDTEVPEVFRVEIKVGRKKDDWLSVLDGYISG